MTEIIHYEKGQDPDRDAWLTNFFTENHLAYETFRYPVASPGSSSSSSILRTSRSTIPARTNCSPPLSKRGRHHATMAYIGIWTRLEGWFGRWSLAL